jgi:hypothetical protein
MHRSPYDRCLVVLTALLLVTVPTLAQKVSDVERRYQAALHTEQVEGNLTAALKAYEGLTAAPNGTTEIRLKALVRQAGIRDTLGLVSDDLYQRVVREFPTRPEAAVAQRKLAARQTPAPAAPLGVVRARLWQSGELQVRAPAQPRTAVFVAQLDGAGRLSAWERRTLANATPRSYVQLGPDNQHVVYVTGSTVRVQDITNAADPGREVYRSATGLTACVWARTQMRAFCGERKGADTEVVAIDIASLGVERLGTFGGVRWPLHVSPDDSVLSFNKDSASGSPPGTGGTSWVIGTDPSTESPPARSFATDRSEDGLWLVDTNSERLVPASGDGYSVALDRNVPRSSSGFIPASIRFTADSQWVIYRGRDAEGRDGVYRMSLSGVKERLGDHPQVAPNAAAWLRFSTDGRYFLVVMDEVIEPN